VCVYRYWVDGDKTKLRMACPICLSNQFVTFKGNNLSDPSKPPRLAWGEYGPVCIISWRHQCDNVQCGGNMLKVRRERERGRLLLAHAHTHAHADQVSVFESVSSR
jgi:hypothetical protein